MKAGLQGVNAAQERATNLATAFEKGTPGVELATVMIESQKATVAFRAATEVRNRLVNAYQEIMNMPI
jgi:flagellar hook-basal body complex protein FliE